MEIRSKTKVKAGVCDLEREDGSLARIDEEKAEVLTNFFSSVFTREDTTEAPDPEPKFDEHDVLQDFLITVEDVKKKLQKLNPSEAPGLDGMHPRVLKETAEVISAPLAQIFAKSIKEGKVPDDWKVAHVRVTAIF